ncbi:MAG: hypothetical protein KDN18_02560 [Verrucomicrobiae bacterium]|nr:hypothetical protein [Verrucomicrobiae bacterium]
MKAFFHALLILPLAWISSRAEEETVPLSPEAPSETDFEALRQTSPFTRVLNLSETYALRGVARINGEQVATLYNRDTKKTIVVTPDGKNDAGISLVGVNRAPELTGVIATISFAGDEAELRYEQSQISPEPKSGPGGGGPPGSTGRPPEGERKGPSPQDIERYKALPEEKQAKLREYVGHVMRNYQNLSREERGNMIRGAMIRLTDGGDIEIPQTPPGQTPSAQPGSPSGGSPQPTTRIEVRQENREDRGDRRDRR